MIFALLAAQAAGTVIDYIGTSNVDELQQQAAQAQQNAIARNIYYTKLESEEASLANMKNLRQTLGTQIAVMAARGTSTKGGSAVPIMQESIGNFNADERIRKINEMMKISNLQTSLEMSKLESSAQSSQLWQGFASRTANRFPTSVSGWKEYGGAVKEGFGLTRAG